MMNVCFLLAEVPTNDVDYGQQKIIALHPRAFVGAHTPIEILEDYYTWAELRRDEDAFMKAQLDWFKKFDRFLRAGLGRNDDDCLEIASSHQNRIKYFVDYLIIRSRIARMFLERSRAGRIRFLREPYSDETQPSLYNFNRHDRWSYLQAFKRASEECGVGFDLIESEKSPKGPSSQGQDKVNPRARQLFKTAYNFFELQKWRAWPGPRNRIPVLFLDGGNASINQIYRKFHQAHADIYFKSAAEIRHISAVKESHMTLNALLGEDGNDYTVRFSDACHTMLRDFASSDLAAWINERADKYAIADTVAYWEDFFLHIIPKTLWEYDAMNRFFKLQKAKFVVARSSSGLNYGAALMAAKNNRIPRICFQHSVGPIDMKGWTHAELAYFDINCPQSTLSTRHFSEVAKKDYPDCKVIESSHYLLNLRRRYAQKYKPSNPVYYVPTKLANGCEHFNIPLYSMSWYFLHQRALIEYFGSRDDFQFVYKDTDGQSWAEQSIMKWLWANKPANVRIVKGPYTQFLGDVGRVVFDYPSTGFFESLAAGIPTLGLHHETFRIWGPMKSHFGASLQSFRDTAEAVGRIEDFLNADPKIFQTTIELSKHNPIPDFMANVESCVTASMTCAAGGVR
jgi:hypothetical protein